MFSVFGLCFLLYYRLTFSFHFQLRINDCVSHFKRNVSVKQCFMQAASKNSIYLREYSLILVMDECSMIPGLCPNGKCIDTSDSYRCMCNQGYQLSRDGKSCVGKNCFLLFH